MVREHSLQPLVSGLGFAEAPRWHAGALWVSDIARHEVLRIDVCSATVERVFNTPGEPSGLGWLPDGSPLVVQMEEHTVLRGSGSALALYAQTGAFSRGKLNDMVVGADGRAWLSNMGFDYETETARSTTLVGLDPQGVAYAAATELWCPNGMAIAPSGRQLVVGQSASRDVLEFDIDREGNLGERRVFGTLPQGACSDGLCMDAAGALWIASPTTREFLRMERGGRISDRVPTPERHAIACVLGGEDRRTLLCLTSSTLSLRAARGTAEGRVGTVRVDVAGAGTP
jgi:sugar lactone lactonase YvrE